MFTSSEAYAIQQRSMKIAKELLAEGYPGYMTAVAVLGWLVSTMPKALADELSKTLTEDVRKFPTYPKE